MGFAFDLGSILLRIARAFAGGGKDLRVQLQLLMGVLAILTILAGLISILGTVIAGLVAIGPVGGELDTFRNFALPIAAILLGALAFIPRSWRTAIDSFAGFISSLVSYVEAGTQRNVVVGRLATFLENLEEREIYQNIHIISYSMGSIIALDCLFPRTPPIRQFSCVHTLFTVGCPADLIRLYWPRFFQNRYRVPGAPKRWINVFTPSDLISSNFIRGNNYAEQIYSRRTLRVRMGIPVTRQEVAWAGIEFSVKEPRALETETVLKEHSEDSSNSLMRHPDKNIRYQVAMNPGPLGFVRNTIYAHQSYWDRSTADAESVLDPIVQDLFPIAAS